MNGWNCGCSRKSIPRNRQLQLILRPDEARIDPQRHARRRQHDDDPEIELRVGPLVPAPALDDDGARHVWEKRSWAIGRRRRRRSDRDRRDSSGPKKDSGRKGDDRRSNDRRDDSRSTDDSGGEVRIDDLLLEVADGFAEGDFAIEVADGFAEVDGGFDMNPLQLVALSGWWASDGAGESAPELREGTDHHDELELD